MSKIDYEITVDVSNVDIETKKRVQDAFFKLGITWGNGAKYTFLNKGCYTNKLTSGKITQDLMWAFEGTVTTHTVDELLELAGMKIDTILKPFDLEKALKGEPVVLRNGKKAYVRHHETEFETGYPLLGYSICGAGGREESWAVEGSFFADKEETGGDIVGMWVEPLVFENWGLIQPELRYLAKDLDGSWYAYPEKPERFTIGWDSGWGGKGHLQLTALIPSLFPECNWKYSLIERPEK